MCESGRVLHHLANHIGSPENGVLFVSFQAQDTLGRRIQEGRSPVRIFGQEHAVRARVYSVEGYSAHADRPELLAWAQGVARAGHLRQVFVVHGEPPGSKRLADELAAMGVADVSVPARGQAVEL
jgi:metallo-beta-lactamase family protein